MKLIDADVADKWMRQNNAFIDAAILKAIPTIDAVPVVRCKDCISHGNCLTEDTFRIARIENPYCCGGKRKEANT